MLTNVDIVTSFTSREELISSVHRFYDVFPRKHLKSTFDIRCSTRQKCWPGIIVLTFQGLKLFVQDQERGDKVDFLVSGIGFVYVDVLNK